MKKLNLYIAKNVLFSVIVVMIVIVFLQSIFVFLGQLNSIRAYYQLPQVLSYVLYTTPGTLYEIIPITTFLGCLIGLGNMASNNELVVMRSAGVSLWQIGLSVMQAALIIIIVGFIIGEYVVPVTEQHAEMTRKLARSPDGRYADEGIWHREGNEYMFFNSIQSDGVLYGINRYLFDDNKRLLEASYADHAMKKGNAWILKNVTGTYFTDNSVKSFNKKEESWHIELDSELLKVLVTKPDDLSIAGLYSYINYLSKQELDSSEYQLALWKKLLAPFSIFSLVIIGISFIFGPLRSISFGLRLFSGVTLGMMFMISQNFIGAASLVFGITPFFAVCAPIVFCLLVGGYLLSKAA